jgi:hypothetical protein
LIRGESLLLGGGKFIIDKIEKEGYDLECLPKDGLRRKLR